MKKLVRKFLPVEPFDMRGLEEWLSAMAAQGLHLAKLGENTARFEPGPPQPETRYALDITGWADIDPERNEMYAQMGWEYVTTLQNLYYVYRSRDPAAPALHTDPVVQSWTFDRLLRRRRFVPLVLLACALFVCRDTLFSVIDNPWSIPNMLLLHTGGTCLYLMLLLLYAFSLTSIVRQRRALKALQKQLADGIPLDESRLRPRRVPRIFTEWGPLVLLLCVTLLWGFWVQPRMTRKLPDPEDWTFPYVTLEQALEGTDVVGLTAEPPQETLLPSPTCRSSLLVPEQIDWSQYGTALLEGGGSEECGIAFHLYRLRFPDTAPLLLRCVQEEHLARWRRYEKNSGDIHINPELVEFQGFQEVDHPAFDQLSVLIWRRADMEVPQKRYAGRVGDLVFTMTCSAPADADLALELFAKEVLS